VTTAPARLFQRPMAVVRPRPKRPWRRARLATHGRLTGDCKRNRRWRAAAAGSRRSSETSRGSHKTQARDRTSAATRIQASPARY